VASTPCGAGVQLRSRSAALSFRLRADGKQGRRATAAVKASALPAATVRRRWRAAARRAAGGVPVAGACAPSARLRLGRAADAPPAPPLRQQPRAGALAASVAAVARAVRHVGASVAAACATASADGASLQQRLRCVDGCCEAEAALWLLALRRGYLAPVAPAR
jgi:hypothetical protein